jgi:lysosomal Pro-X carboxypeptidase
MIDLGKVILLGASIPSMAVTASYKTLYYNQTLDHVNNFDPSHPKFSHRYLLNDDNWGKKKLTGECPGPILMYTGNEAPVTAFWSGNGFMIDYLAPKWGALVFFPEQRYYGESIPSSSMEYLTTQNVLEDFVELLGFVQKEYKAENCPVVSFGGSYGATLTTLLREAYPTVIIGGLASSQELGYYDPENWESHGVDEFTFSDIVTKDYDSADPQCLDAISATKVAIDQTSTDELVKAFNLCDASGLGPHKTDLYLYGLEGLCQQNYPYAVGTMPAWPVTYVCKQLVQALNTCTASSCLVDAAAAMTNLALGVDPSEGCMETLEEGPGNIPGDGPGLGAWGYQSCTETLHLFSSRGIRDYEFDYKTSALEPCTDIWNVAPDTNALTMRYGGFDIGDGKTDITNMIWSNGLLDPWHGGGFFPEHAPPDAAERGLYYFMIASGAHHLDLRGPHPEDPADVTAVRHQEEAIIWGWIQDYVKTAGK